jgi:hypothetical protein
MPPSSPGMPPSTPGMPPTGTTTGTTPGGMAPPAPPESLGGGMAPPVAGTPPSGPEGTTTVPFNPMPNF